MQKIVLSPRRHRLAEQLRRMGFEVTGMLPPAPLQGFSKKFLKAGTEQQYQLSNQYNKWLCQMLGLDYYKTKKSVPNLIEQTYGLNKRCGICRYFRHEVKSLKPLSCETKCLLSGAETGSEDLCENYIFNLGLFLDSEGWKAFV